MVRPPNGIVQAIVPSRQDLLVGAILTIGILAVIVAMKATPPPWSGWFK